jgi:hypothetical protein
VWGDTVISGFKQSRSCWVFSTNAGGGKISVSIFAVIQMLLDTIPPTTSAHDFQHSYHFIFGKAFSWISLMAWQLVLLINVQGLDIIMISFLIVWSLFQSTDNAKTLRY